MKYLILLSLISFSVYSSPIPQIHDDQLQIDLGLTDAEMDKLIMEAKEFDGEFMCPCCSYQSEDIIEFCEPDINWEEPTMYKPRPGYTKKELEALKPKAN